MTPKTKKHYDRILELMNQHRQVAEYGAIAPAYACITDDPSLIHDFGSEYEKECGRTLTNAEAVNRLRYILSLLEMDGKVIRGSFGSATGWINIYDLPDSLYVKFHRF